VKVSTGKETREFHLDGAGKQFVFPLREIVKKEHKESSEEASQLVVEVQFVPHTT
jgi:hypothetical protein